MINGERMEKWVVKGRHLKISLPESLPGDKGAIFQMGLVYSWIDTLKEVVQKKFTE